MTSTLSPRVRDRVEPVRKKPPLSDSLLTFSAVAYLFAIPLDAVAVFGGRSWSALIGLVLLAAWGLSLLESGRHRKTERSTAKSILLILVVSFLVLLFLKLPSSYVLDVSWARTITYVAQALAILALARAFRQGQESPIWALVSATTILSILVTVTAQVGLSEDSNFRATSLGLNSNQAACMLVVGTLFAGVLAVKQSGWRRNLLLAAVAMQAIATLSTGSRTGAIALVLGAIFLPVLSISDPGKRAARLTMSIFVLAVGVASTWMLRGFFPARLRSTLDAIRTGDLSTREDIWAAAAYYQDVFLPWGVGLGNAGAVTALAYGQEKDMHNTYLLALVELGYLGAILEVSILITALVVAWRSPYRMYVFAGMIPILTFSYTTSLFHFKILWVLIALALVRKSAPSSQRELPGGTTATAPLHGH